MKMNAGYHIATTPRRSFAALVFDARNRTGLLAQVYERNTSAPWSDAAREKALGVLTARNVLFHQMMTGNDTLRSNRDGALPA